MLVITKTHIVITILFYVIKKIYFIIIIYMYKKNTSTEEFLNYKSQELL